MARAVLALALLLAMVGCAGGDEREVVTVTVTERIEWEGPPRRSNDGSVEFGPFNRYAAEARGAWRRSPLQTAIVFLALHRQQAMEKTIAYEQRRAGPPAVVATLDRIPDDSVRALRYTLELTREDDGTWRIYKARWTQRCWPNRGHQDFSAELCV